jgi:hypothetical protein
MDQASLAELRDIRKHANETNELLRQLYYKTQAVEADKTPDKIRARSIGAPSVTENILLAGANDHRKYIIISNGLSVDMLINDTPYDQVPHDFATAGYNQVIPGYVLTAGSEIKLDTASIIYGLPVSTGASAGTFISIIECLYSNLPNQHFYKTQVSPEIINNINLKD